MTELDPDHQTSRIVLVQCTSAKRDEAAPARDLYDESSYFRKQRKYAQAFGDHWYVQSALHGLVHPDELIDPYDVRADDIDDPDGWAEAIADALEHRFDDGVIEVLGGKAYADPLTPELEARGFEVLEPLRGQRIGTRQKTLSEKMNQSLEAFA